MDGMDQMDDMEELAGPLERTAKSLLESGAFDSVLVIATFVDGRGRTCRLSGEAGNGYASHGAALDWAKRFDASKDGG